MWLAGLLLNWFVFFCLINSLFGVDSGWAGRLVRLACLLLDSLIDRLGFVARWIALCVCSCYVFGGFL